MPKLPQPPRSAQKSSVFDDSDAVTTSPQYSSAAHILELSEGDGQVGGGERAEWVWKIARGRAELRTRWWNEGCQGRVRRCAAARDGVRGDTPSGTSAN